MAEELSRQGVHVDSGDRDRRALIGCTVIGGYGHEMPTGTQIHVLFDQDAIRLIVPGGDTSAVPYGDVIALEIEGRGAVRSGAGFIGGGFGAKAAAEGILAASVLNALTAKTRIETIIGLRTKAWQVFLFWDRETPNALQRNLAPALSRLDGAHEADGEARGSTEPAIGVAAELAKLDELHKSGALNAAEFAGAKKKLIDGH